MKNKPPVTGSAARKRRAADVHNLRYVERNLARKRAKHIEDTLQQALDKTEKDTGRCARK